MYTIEIYKCPECLSVSEDEFCEECGIEMNYFDTETLPCGFDSHEKN